MQDDRRIPFRWLSLPNFLINAHQSSPSHLEKKCLTKHLEPRPLLRTRLPPTRPPPAKATQHPPPRRLMLLLRRRTLLLLATLHLQPRLTPPLVSDCNFVFRGSFQRLTFSRLRRSCYHQDYLPRYVIANLCSLPMSEGRRILMCFGRLPLYFVLRTLNYLPTFSSPRFVQQVC
jgi:hypothetical protein